MEEPGRTSRPVVVRMAEGDPIGPRTATVAERLGVPLVHATLAEREGADATSPAPGSTEGRPRIGDVAVPRDAPQWYIEAALLRAQEPHHVLFLCVANSARSQLAEGIARHLARNAGRAARPRAVKVSSAGSDPSSVRPQAVAVLAEIGIDISDQRSTGVDEVEGGVDAVVTLCAEEVCPVWLGDALRLHWGLPDPAAAEGTEEERLDAFREVRDELLSRLGVLFTGRPAGRSNS